MAFFDTLLKAGRLLTPWWIAWTIWGLLWQKAAKTDAWFVWRWFQEERREEVKRLAEPKIEAALPTARAAWATAFQRALFWTTEFPQDKIITAQVAPGEPLAWPWARLWAMRETEVAFQRPEEIKARAAAFKEVEPEATRQVAEKFKLPEERIRTAKFWEATKESFVNNLLFWIWDESNTELQKVIDATSKQTLWSKTGKITWALWAWILDFLIWSKVLWAAKIPALIKLKNVNPFLYEATVENLAISWAEAAARKVTGQEYWATDFLINLWAWAIWAWLAQWVRKLKWEVPPSVFKRLTKFNNITDDEYSVINDALWVQKKLNPKSTPDEYLNAIRDVSVTDTQWNKKVLWQMMAESRLEKTLERSAPKTKLSDFKWTRDMFQPTSTTLRNVHFDLYDAQKKYESWLNLNVQNRTEQVWDFLEWLAKIKDKNLKDELTLSLFNWEKKVTDKILRQVWLEDAYTKVRWLFDDVAKEAKTVGIDLKPNDTYFTRWVKDFDWLMDKIYWDDNFSFILRAIQKKEKQLWPGKVLSDIEKDKIVNSMLRWFWAKIWTAKSWLTKSRWIERVTKDILPFYHDPEEWLLNYIENVTREIEMRKFFWKWETNEESIWNLTRKLLEKWEITKADEKEVRDILQAYFKPWVMWWLWKWTRDLVYASTIWNPISAITNLEDLAISMTEWWVWNTIKSVGRSVAGKSKITVDDLGLDVMFEELRKDKTFTSKMLNKTLWIVWFKKLDKIWKEALLNANYWHLLDLTKTNPARATELVERFMWDRTPWVIKDISEWRVTNEVKEYLFRKLSSSQPISASEMPLNYLKWSNTKLFYQLKSFQLKRLDFIRNELLWEVKRNPVEWMKKIAKFSIFLVANWYWVDSVKDWMLWRETDPSDRFIDQLLKLGTLTKYQIHRAKDVWTIQTAIDTITPPWVGIAQLIERDFRKAAEWSEEKFEFPKLIPVLWKAYYWLFWRWADKAQVSEAQTFRREEVISSQKKTKEATKIINSFAELSNEERRQELTDLAKTDPVMAKKVLSKIKEKAVWLSSEDKIIKRMWVASWKRAEFIFKKIEALPDEEAKQLLLDYSKKKVMTEEVFRQVLKLKQWQWLQQ